MGFWGFGVIIKKNKSIANTKLPASNEAKEHIRNSTNTPTSNEPSAVAKGTNYQPLKRVLK